MSQKMTVCFLWERVTGRVKSTYTLAPAAGHEKRRALAQRRIDWTAPHEIKETRRA
ncbi:hypothetical protein [Pseudobacillus wudalianchiensis]|uniref:hypothetical protein n=1 Tax=Pseudobacillus wudalianchiensis TaxID=1743143 RepID=UPI00159F2FA4|nr:hypothetical protein [Bacillus wudalianchiensis]